jgi:hypothetical protein
MANEQYLHMLDLGEWLAKLYAPDLQGSQMRGLAEDALKLLGITYDIDKNDPVLLSYEKDEERFKLMLGNTDAAATHYNYAFYLRIVSLNILRHILSSKKTWNLSITQGSLDDSTLAWFSIMCNSYYGMIGESFTYIPDEGLKKIRSFKDPQTDMSIFPWHIAISRILIEFLENGGEKYFGFCEYCGKFYVVQREGRKRYCSGRCRSYASLTKHKKI